MTAWQQKHLRLEAHHPKIQELADAASNMAKWFANAERVTHPVNLVICGNSGTGKTHTAFSLYRWARNYSGRVGAVVDCFSWPEACESIAEGFYGVVHDMIAADFLVLDDIGAETDKYKSGIMLDKLCQVLSRREQEFTVITTNIGMENWESKLDVRVTDRLIRNSVVVDLSGVPSYSVNRLLTSK